MGTHAATCDRVVLVIAVFHVLDYLDQFKAIKDKTWVFSVRLQ